MATYGYIIYNFRVGGWLSKSGSLISDWKRATRFTREDALNTCRRHKDHDGFTCAPVERGLMEAADDDESF